MTKKNIYISFLPLFVIIILIIGAGYFLMVDEIKLPKFNTGAQIRRIEGFPTSSFVDETFVADKQRIVIRSEKELDEFLNSVDKSGMLTMRDKINFEKEYLVAVSSEVEKIDNHRIKIRKVYEDKESKTILFSIIETYPGETCDIEINPHIGVDIVAVNNLASRTDWKIDFERVKDSDECGEKETSTTTPAAPDAQ